MTNTALSAKAEQIAQTVTFRNEKHKRFFLTYLPKCRYGDRITQAKVYQNDRKRSRRSGEKQWHNKRGLGILPCGNLYRADGRL